MPDFINSKKLKDIGVEQSKKFKSTVYLKKNCYAKIESLITITDCTSRNDVIEKAIDFFFAFNTSQLNQDYLCGVFGTKIEGLVNNLATRISKGNFRSAVETDILTRLLSATINLNRAEYDKLRIKAIQDVKKTNGSINILEAVDESDNN